MSKKIQRGGSFRDDTWDIRVPRLYGDQPEARDGITGFRVVREEEDWMRRGVRGGSWGGLQERARADYRYNVHPSARYLSFGFRVVKEE